MKTIKIFAFAIAALVWAGCGNAPHDSTAVADSLNHQRDSTDKKGPDGYIHEISRDDAEFAVEAANGGMAEVELGKLANEKATDPRVKEFGMMMVTDHSKANAELKAIADSNKIVLPAVLNAEAQKLKDELSKKSGADFDKAYVKAMVDDHEKDVKAFERAGKMVKYPNMQQFINKTLPVLKKHLTEIKQISDQQK